MNKHLSIVIPSKNEKRNVLAVLKLISKQKLDCMIYVADASDDMYSFSFLYNHMLHSGQAMKIIKGGTPAVGRNKGAAMVTTPYVLFMDADVYLTNPTLLTQCLETAMAGDYDLVTCKFKTFEKGYNWIYRVFDKFQWFSSKTKPFALGGFMLFKTSKFNELGGFNELDEIAEDYHLSMKVDPNKFKIVNAYAFTPARRFKNKGIWYMTKIFFGGWWNRNNDRWFQKDHDYWK